MSVEPADLVASARDLLQRVLPRSESNVDIDNADFNDPKIAVPDTVPPPEDPCDLTIDNYDATTDLYVRVSARPSEAVLRYLDAFAALVPRGHVLELGSDPGWDAEYVERLGVRVSRSDAVPGFVERLRAAGHEARLLDARSTSYGGPFD